MHKCLESVVIKPYSISVVEVEKGTSVCERKLKKERVNTRCLNQKEKDLINSIDSQGFFICFLYNFFYVSVQASQCFNKLV